MASTPLVQHYQQALERCRERKEPLPVERQMVALLDLATTLEARLDDSDRLSTALRIVMEEVDAERGAFFARLDDGSLSIRASKGLAAEEASTHPPKAPEKDPAIPEQMDEVDTPHGLVMLCPIRRCERTIGMLGLGPRAGGLAYGTEEQAFLRAAAACAAAPLTNLLLDEELRRVKKELSLKVFQVQNLFDIGRELTGDVEEKRIHSNTMTTAMGHFLVTRCALYLLGPLGLALADERGLRRQVDRSALALEEARAALQELAMPRPVAGLSDGPLRRRLEENRLTLAVPLIARDGVIGVLAIGERSSRTPLSEEDLDFAQTLARHAAAALEGARLHRVRLEKQRQDDELRVAQEIQRSLFPARTPAVPGFEVVGHSRPCYEVGGDSYDWIELGDGRLALVIADVSGKGTPASLLMAYVHAFVQARAGTDSPTQLMERLNRVLLDRTQPKFVTMFYAELDPAARRLAYVNAGHVPPFHVARDGTVHELSDGGLPLGLFEEATYAEGHARLESGDVVAMVTDGLTEAGAPEKSEFGSRRASEILRALSAGSAPSILGGLVAAVDAYASPAGCSDDLTILVLKAL